MVSDLVKRLRWHGEYEPLGMVGWEAAYRIEQLERELSAEMALADRLYSFLNGILVGPAFADEADKLEDSYRARREGK